MAKHKGFTAAMDVQVYLAAGHERKYKLAPAAILPARNGLVSDTDGRCGLGLEFTGRSLKP